MVTNLTQLGYVNNYDKNRYLENFSKAAVKEKVKTVDFSETIAASDLKGTRSRHLIRRYVSIEGQGHFLTFAQGSVHTKFKLDFLRNYCTDLNQILYESFQVQGNENLMTSCWSHDQDGHHTDIW